MIAGLALVALLGLAQTGDDAAEKAVATAKNAFEYRDMEAVVKLLEPWLHPPRITDRKLMLEARKLMGVSLHVLDRADAAKEEFAQLLLIDPRHSLDPAVVPPDVIQAFEEVRSSMKDTLNRILAERGQKPIEDDQGPVKLKVVAVPSTPVAFLLFGGPQLALDQPVLALSFGGLQLAGLVLNAVGFWRGHGIFDQASDLDRALTQGRLLWASGLLLFVGSYAVSVIHALVSIDARAAAITAQAEATPGK